MRLLLKNSGLVSACGRSYWELGGVVERFEDLGHLPPSTQVHPEARHGAAGSQADNTGHTHTNVIFV